jgi:hypothetical protein
MFSTVMVFSLIPLLLYVWQAGYSLEPYIVLAVHIGYALIPIPLLLLAYFYRDSVFYVQTKDTWIISRCGGKRIAEIGFGAFRKGESDSSIERLRDSTLPHNATAHDVFCYEGRIEFHAWASANVIRLKKPENDQEKIEGHLITSNLSSKLKNYLKQGMNEAVSKALDRQGVKETDKTPESTPQIDLEHMEIADRIAKDICGHIIGLFDIQDDLYALIDLSLEVKKVQISVDLQNQLRVKFS